MDEYLAMIKLFAGTFAPRGFLYCDGKVLSVAQNQALFSLLGPTYGGDGQNTFALPDLRGRVPVGSMGQGPGLTNYPLGASTGAEFVTLTAAQIPSHTHTLYASGATGTANTPTNQSILGTPPNVGSGPAAAPVKIFVVDDKQQDVALSSGSIGAAGGNQAHSNVQPTLGLNYVITVDGIYPSRPDY